MLQMETKRLVLRNFEPKDLDALCDYRSDARCARFQRWEKKDIERDGLAQMIQDKRDSGLSMAGKQQFAVALKDSDELVGDVTVFLENPTITLGYTVSYQYHRRGYAFEMLSALTEHLHAIYPERELICLVEPENAASIGLLRKLGFEDLGYAEKITSQIYGKWAITE